MVQNSSKIVSIWNQSEFEDTGHLFSVLLLSLDYIKSWSLLSSLHNVLVSVCVISTTMLVEGLMLKLLNGLTHSLFFDLC